MASQPIEAAIAAGEAQWERLVYSGFEAYAAGMDAYAVACDAACEAFTADAHRYEESRFAELIALDQRIAAELRRQKHEVTVRLAGLNSGRRASGAYLSVAQPTRPAVALAAARARARLEA